MSKIGFLDEQIHLIWVSLLSCGTSLPNTGPLSYLPTCSTPVSMDLRGIRLEPEKTSLFLPSCAGIQGVTPV